MDAVTYIVLIAFVVSMFGSVVGVIMLQRIAHRERMELLKLIKASSLTEYSMDQPKSKPIIENNNFMRQAMKNEYNKRQDDENE